MNRRRLSSGLSRADVNAVIDAWYYARAIGLPLNVLVTVKPSNADALTIADLCGQFDRIKNLCGQFARRHGYWAAYLWAREVSVHQSGGHMHLLCHVPRELYEAFRRCALQWLGRAGECDVTRATYRQTIARDGNRHSIGLYLSKQMTPQACFARPIRRVKGGKIEGRRWGCSRNLLPRMKGEGGVQSLA